ncbi:hypothetical protein FSP39_014029, partial [Pinctada imbricata]
DKETDTYGRKRMFFSGKEICNNFNGERGCKLFMCNNSHICLDCKGDHSRLSCPNAKKRDNFSGQSSCSEKVMIRGVCTPINVDKLEAFPQNHPDSPFYNIVCALPHQSNRSSRRKYSGKKRLIVDMSSPHNNENSQSINDLIVKEVYCLHYVTIDDAIKVIERIGQGAWLMKTDITDSLKTIPVHQSLCPFQGIQWENQYYFYTQLAFGSRSSLNIFDYLSKAVC